MKLVNYFRFCVWWQFLLCACFLPSECSPSFPMFSPGVADSAETQHQTRRRQPYLHVFWPASPSSPSWWMKKCSSQAGGDSPFRFLHLSQSFAAKASILVLWSISSDLRLRLGKTPLSIDIQLLPAHRLPQLPPSTTCFLVAPEKVIGGITGHRSFRLPMHTNTIA